MAATSTDQRSQRRNRGLRFFLRDYRILEAEISLAEGQTLAAFLSSRRRFMSLRSAQWAGSEAVTEHLLLQVRQILWASAISDDVPLLHVQPAAKPRMAELTLDHGLVIRAGLSLVEHQRLSDYLESASAFIPLKNARLLPRGIRVGEIAINQEFIQLAREIPLETDAGEPAAVADPAEVRAAVRAAASGGSAG